jgi:transposase
LIETHTDQQFQTEIPRQPQVRQFNIHRGHCPHCRKPYRGRHRLQTSDATGAAQSQRGPDAQAAVVYLNKDAGLSHGKVAKVFGRLYGISLSRGASAQIVLRAAQRLQPACQEIREQPQTSAHLTPDETGWRVGGQPAWLHAWVGDQGATCYVIDAQRSAWVLEAVIGGDWSGTMTHDGFASYDRFAEAVHQQCVGHALRRARTLAEKQRHCQELT